MLRQGPLCLIEMLVSSVGSSLVQWLALEFSSCQIWGSRGSCSLCDEHFPRLPQPTHPTGELLTWGVCPHGCIRACVCAHAGVPVYVSV